MLQKVRLIISCWAVCASLSNPAWAEQAGHPQEKDRAYVYKGNELQKYGGGINSDIMHLDRLFGTAAYRETLSMHQDEKPEIGWLGIAMKLPAQLPKEPGTDLVLQAIEVSGVMQSSAAEAAGLREGDLIVGCDGQPIVNREDKTLLSFRLSISNRLPGEHMKLRILRGNKLLELDAELQSYPRTNSVLKPHPNLAIVPIENEKSLLNDVLEKEGLTGEFVRILKEFRTETDKVDSPMIRKDDYNPFQLPEVNYVLYNPLHLPQVARMMTDRLNEDFDAKHRDLAALVATAMDELDMMQPAVKPDGGNIPADIAGYLARLAEAIRHANSERAAVLSVLNDGELDFLYAMAPELLGRYSGTVIEENTNADEQAEEARLLRFFSLMLKLDMPRLLNAAAAVSQALDLETLARLVRKPGNLRYPRDWTVRKENNLTVIDTPAGRVLIGGDQDNRYTKDAALILDFGGNDQYLNSAGGSTRLNPYSVVIDLSGDDVYTAADDFAQGAGLIGGGFLVDLEGNDHYTARNYSQGAGILGVGILADLAGRDRYTAYTVSQGAASFGIGLIAEGGGDDSYSGNYFVQGAGYIKGMGAIVDAAGNDNYFVAGLYEDFRAPGKSYVSLSQGFGYGMRPREFISAAGGIGVIAEAGGNDTYVADYFAQGASYWFALGILDDRKGHDRYISGRYSQGAGIHISAGALLDGEGDDNYLADYGVAQGCGHDYGIGFLLDNGGSDRYTAGVIAQGAGNDSGIGVLSDNGGDDAYYLMDIGQGSGNFEPLKNLGSFGFLFDTGGGIDRYSQGAKNNSLNYKTRWGILLDTN